MPKQTDAAHTPPLNERQRRFAELYAATGNALQSAIGAGYSEQSARSQSDRLLKNAEVLAYLRTMTAEARASRIADVAELREFWTSTFRDGAHEMKDRLKASDMLGKSLGVFIEKREQSGGLKIQVVYGDE